MGKEDMRRGRGKILFGVCVRRSERTHWTPFSLGRVEDEYETLSHSFHY